MTTMKKLGFLFAALALVFTAGCEPQEILEPTDPEDVQGGRARFEIRVTIDPETKATMEGKTLTFALGDKIAILVTSGTLTEPYDLVATRIESSAVVFSEDPDNLIPDGATVGEYVYYPFDLIWPDEDPLVISWPNRYFADQGVAIPMMAKIDLENNRAVFKHLGAMLKVNLVNVPSNNNWLEFKTSTKFVCQYRVDPSNNWSLTPVTSESDLNSEYLEAKTSGVYYIPIPAGTYADFQLGMMSSDNYGFPAYYNKQRTAILSSAITPVRTNIVNLGDFTYDVDEIAEWWHVSLMNGWASGYNRYIKTGANTYQITAFNPSANLWWKLLDGDGYAWRTADDKTAWAGQLSQLSDPDNCTFNRTGADDKTFWVTLSKNGDNWEYNSGNWENNSDREWGTSAVQFKSSLDNWGNGKTLTKYDYGANYSFQYKGLFIPDNKDYEFKFVCNGTWCGASGLNITDASPYGTATWNGGDNIHVRLTPGTYDIYIDVATLNFMFVKQPNPATTTTP